MKQMLQHLKQRTNQIGIFQRFWKHLESDGFVASSGRMSDIMWATCQHGQVHNHAVGSSWTHLTERGGQALCQATDASGYQPDSTKSERGFLTCNG